MDSEIAEKLAEMRKLERQAKQLIYKMGRLEAQWERVKKELQDKGKDIPHGLGDILYRFQKKSLR